MVPEEIERELTSRFPCLIPNGMLKCSLVLEGAELRSEAGEAQVTEPVGGRVLLSSIILVS